MGLVKEGAAETARRQLSLLGKKTGGGLARSGELVDAALVAVAREDAARREGASGGVGGRRCSAGVGSPRRVGKAEWGQSFGSTGRVLRRVAMAFIASGVCVRSAICRVKAASDRGELAILRARRVTLWCVHVAKGEARSGRRRCGAEEWI